ncbi:thioredoxin, partial [Curtobacterium flaccumfaciens]
MTVIVAVAVLAGVLALATVLGLLLRSRTGRAKPSPTAPDGTASTVDGLASADAFGSRATLVQFSTPTCARCPATRRLLDAVADHHEGVRRIEIDLAEH